MNLYRALSSKSKYVLLLSDDDYIDSDYLISFIEVLYEKKPDLLVSPYQAIDLHRNGEHYLESYSIDVLYDSILFSGLTFKTELIQLNEKEINFLEKSIYIQVYLLCKYWSTNSLYFNKPLIITGSDGENFFGKSKSTSSMSSLINRDDLMSNVYYHVYFQRVVFKCLSTYYPKLIDDFLKSYGIRLVSHFVRIRLASNHINYINCIFELLSIKVKYKLRYLIYILFIAFIPKIILDPAYKITLKRFRKSGG